MVSKRLSREEGHRRKFLAVIDDTPECERAVHYAASRARRTNGVLVLIFVIEPGDFQHWLGVEEIMKAEAREEADAALERFAAQVRENSGIEPELKIRMGKTTEEIHAIIEEDQDIAILVLASGSAKEGPGPLVSSIAGRGAAFPIPVTVIPDALSDEDIEALC
ncbi:universal stress protein [Hoeflea sp. TYP-13]|uniref:universal stress protein n=1 Tax=Hoeflea sp. TYP-13 TaxID=3230023 RepID=UPI0034C610F8